MMLTFYSVSVMNMWSCMSTDKINMVRAYLIVMVIVGKNISFMDESFVLCNTCLELFALWLQVHFLGVDVFLNCDLCGWQNVHSVNNADLSIFVISLGNNLKRF